MKKIVCFDLDDTLIDDNYKFEIASCDCIRVIINALESRSPMIDDILDKAREIDNYKWETWAPEDRYMPKRTALTWVETYEHFAKELHFPVKAHIKRLLWSIVMVTYDPPYFVIPGTIETLLEIKKRGYHLHLLTIGLPAIQRKKVQLTRLHKYFDVLHIVRADKKLILENIAKEHGKENMVMVGNSMRSDINPAMELGIEAIYFPRGNWHRFKAEPVSNNYKQVKYLDEILNYLPR